MALRGTELSKISGTYFQPNCLHFKVNCHVGTTLFLRREKSEMLRTCLFPDWSASKRRRKYSIRRLCSPFEKSPSGGKYLLMNGRNLMDTNCKKKVKTSPNKNVWLNPKIILSFWCTSIRETAGAEKGTK